MAHPSHKSRQAPPPEVVEGAWLLKAFAVVVIAALLCTYATLCILFSKSQWQLVLHPVQTSEDGSAKDLIHFGAGDTGQPQLTGEWLPASTSSGYSHLTVLFLSGGDGTRKDFAETQTALRNLGLNVFTFDYRGYGSSAKIHPSQQRMLEDGETAWKYLTGTRKVPGRSILPYGVGVGTSLATRLALEHGEIAAVMLDSPYCDLRDIFRNNPKFRFLPVGLLFHEDFPLRAPLSSLPTPKLLISHKPSREAAAYDSAAAPKIIVTVSASSSPQFEGAVRQLLNQYVAVSSSAPAATTTH
jgi:pimeloyl-ACP methyl ester carboxylesterase